MKFGQIVIVIINVLFVCLSHWGEYVIDVLSQIGGKAATRTEDNDNETFKKILIVFEMTEVSAKKEIR